jgi:hypothetical protein
MTIIRRPPRPVPSDAVYISRTQLQNRWGGVSHMWIERRLKDNPDFPKPKFMGRLRFWKISELEAYERSCATSRVKEVA